MSTSQGVNVRPTFPSLPTSRVQLSLELHTDGLQVLRWSALVAGIFYGFSHQRTITANTAAAHAQAEYQHKVDLIQKAKAEWAKKNLPPQAKTASGDSTCLNGAEPNMRLTSDGSYHGSQRQEL